MATDEEWFRSPDWSPEAQQRFEAKLRRARSYGRAQYVRIKAVSLLGSGNPSCREAGKALLHRIIEEYPEAWMEAVFAHEELGRLFAEEGQFALAEEHYRHCLAFYSRSRSGGSGLCDLRLAELILDTEQQDKYGEAISLLISASSHLAFNSDRYRHALASARLYQRMGQYTEAATHARTALALAAIQRPEFSRHPTVGLVKATPSELEELRQLVETEPT